MKIIAFIGFWLALTMGQAQQHNLDNLRYLLKDTAIYGRIQQGIYEHPALEIGMKKEFKAIHQRNYPIRVAIDPGHVASSRKESVIEERYINSKYGFFYESELNMATGLLLKRMLEARGFEVLLTRNAQESAYGLPYLKWYRKKFRKELQDDFQKGVITAERYESLRSASKKVVFDQYFKNKDFISREEKINAFAPDITLIIHYNASEFENSTVTHAPEVPHNYSVCFVPGGFTQSELREESHLEDFIRLASTDNIGKSIQLSQFIAREFEAKLGAPLLKPGDLPALWYLDKYSVYAGSPGIFSRNLFMTRRIVGPVCYGECLLQNNSEEIQRLARKEITIGPYQVSSRVKDVAECYYTGVIKYFQRLGWMK